MTQIEPVLTGAHAAALLGLDGFRGRDWPTQWCAPHAASPETGVIRTRRWGEPLLVGDVSIATPFLVLAHLGLAHEALVLAQHDDAIEPRDRIELAVEHALRDRLVTLRDFRFTGVRGPGENLLREVISMRGDEPPTESYAETEYLQFLRALGYDVWRQMVVVGNSGQFLYRVDFVIALRRMPRSKILRPSLGLITELDSEEYHEGAFQRDHIRNSTFDALGYHWISVTPTQVTRRPAATKRAIQGALLRMTRPTKRNRVNPHRRVGAPTSGSRRSSAA